MSLFLFSCPCLCLQFTLTANSSPSTHGLLTISLPTVPGHFQSDLYAQTKHLIILLRQRDIQDKQNEVRFLKGRCYCIISCKTKYLPMSFCTQDLISTGISAWSPLASQASGREAFAAVLQHLSPLKQMGITSQAPLMVSQVGFFQY